jgi:MazG family protein
MYVKNASDKMGPKFPEASPPPRNLKANRQQSQVPIIPKVSPAAPSPPEISPSQDSLEGHGLLPAPIGPSSGLAQAALRLESLLDGLLHPQKGCPWDREQTISDLSECFLEECFELREAILTDNEPGMREEAGDVAFLLAFLARLAKARWDWGLAEILDETVDKLVYRHPHVFAPDQSSESGHKAEDSEAVLKQWHALKRKKKPQEGLLASVPLALPALARCHRLGSKAGRAGFDFPDIASVRAKLDEEIGELDRELSLGDIKNPQRQRRLMEELGDVLCAVANLSRHLGFSAEKALDASNTRFVKRFSYIEKKLKEMGLTPEEAGMGLLERLWQEAKMPDRNNGQVE